MTVGQRLKSWLKWLGSRDENAVIRVLTPSDWHISSDLIKYLLERNLIQILGSQRQARSNHAAANVDTYSGGNDRLVRGDDRTDGCANAQMYVGHGRNVVVHKRQAGDIGQLFL